MGVVNSQERETINSPKTGPCLCFQDSTSNWIRDKQSAHADSRKLQNQTIISNLLMNSKLTSFLTIKISVINKQSESKTAKIRLILMFIFPTWSRILWPLQTLQSLLFFFFFYYLYLISPEFWSHLPYCHACCCSSTCLSVKESTNLSLGACFVNIHRAECFPVQTTRQIVAFPAEEECRQSGFQKEITASEHSYCYLNAAVNLQTVAYNLRQQHKQSWPTTRLISSSHLQKWSSGKGQSGEW